MSGLKLGYWCCCCVTLRFFVFSRFGMTNDGLKKNKSSCGANRNIERTDSGVHSPPSYAVFFVQGLKEYVNTITK